MGDGDAAAQHAGMDLLGFTAAALGIENSKKMISRCCLLFCTSAPHRLVALESPKQAASVGWMEGSKADLGICGGIVISHLISSDLI